MTINPALNREVLIAQLLAARAMAETTIAQIDVTLTALGLPIEDDADGGCAHPMDQREDLTTMGGPLERRCRACGFHSTTEPPSAPQPEPITEG